MTDRDDRFVPVPIPLGDGRHDIGDDVRAAIVSRLMDDWSHDPDLRPEKVRQLAMWAAASVRSLLHELGTLRDAVLPADASPVGPGADGKCPICHTVPQPSIPGPMAICNEEGAIAVCQTCAEEIADFFGRARALREVSRLTAQVRELEQERVVAVRNARFEAAIEEGERIANRVFDELPLDANVSDGNESADPVDHIVPCVRAVLEAAESRIASLEQENESLKDAIAPFRHTPEDAECWETLADFLREVRELREAHKHDESVIGELQNDLFDSEARLASLEGALKAKAEEWADYGWDHESASAFRQASEQLLALTPSAGSASPTPGEEMR
jgi:hypothetical protein